MRALQAADQIVIGPGSLYTSVLAACCVPALRDAIASTPAQRVYVANLREQPPETAGYDVAAHVAALARHGVVIDVVLADSGGAPDRRAGRRRPGHTRRCRRRGPRGARSRPPRAAAGGHAGGLRRLRGAVASESMTAGLERLERQAPAGGVEGMTK